MSNTRSFLLSAFFCGLATIVSAQTFTVLHDFELTDGLNPQGTLAKDSAGNLYGTTRFGGEISGGNEGDGVIYRLSESGDWKVIVLYEFTDGSDGAQPETGLIAGPGGGFGTVPFGGNMQGTYCGSDGGCGTVYQMARDGKFSVLYSFMGAPDGAQPFAPLFLAADGSFYGTTELGGNLDCPFNTPGCGTVYQVDANGNEKVIYSFLGPDNNGDGANPFSAVVQDAAGNLYGSTIFGGTMNNDVCEPDAGCGTIFELSPNNDGSWTETVIYRFQGGADGNFPAISLFVNSEGALYGTTPNGGNLAECGGLGCGTIFKMTQNNGQWTKSIVYAFQGADGDEPESPLVRDSAGNLYGATENGGDLNCAYYQNIGCGVVFRLDKSGNEVVLHKFSGTDGLFPGGGVLLNEAAGALYGTTTEGGDIANCSLTEYYDGCGVVYEVKK